MDFQLNKILGAILGTLLFVMGLGFLADAIYAPAQSAGPGFALPSEAEGGPGNGNGATAAVADIGTLLAKADPKAGETSAKKCAACHDFTDGGPNKTGPNLFDVVERPIASHPGFSYSAALQGKASDKWTYENLNAWLTSPKTFAPGTKMSYAGDKDDTDRANLIAYLSTLSKSPKPFPAPAAPAAPAASAPSSEAAPAPASSSAAAAAPAAASSEAPAAPAASSTAPAAPASSEAPAAPASSQAPAAPASSEAAPASSSAAQ